MSSGYRFQYIRAIFKNCFNISFLQLRNSIADSKWDHTYTPDLRVLEMKDGSKILWDHFEAAETFNTRDGFRYHARLTKEHIQLSSTSKMRNHLAKEVLNTEMLRLMCNLKVSLILMQDCCYRVIYVVKYIYATLLLMKKLS